jgi:hypothetical protein
VRPDEDNTVHAAEREPQTGWMNKRYIHIHAETPRDLTIDYGQETTATSTSSAEHNGGLLSLQPREIESKPPHCFRVRRAVNGRLSPTHRDVTKKKKTLELGRHLGINA